MGARFYMDFGFIRASSVNYKRQNINSDCVIDSYDKYSSYLLIVDNKSFMSWIFLTKSKSPPLDIVRLFLCSFGHNLTLGGFIRCNQGGELVQSHALIDMALTEFGYKVKPTGAGSPSQNRQASVSLLSNLETARQERSVLLLVEQKLLVKEGKSGCA